MSFQPVSFTGRDEDISDEERHAQALHAVAPRRRREAPDRRHRAAARLVSAVGVERDFATSPTCCKGPGADWGTLKCGCHPDCGIGTALHGQQEDQGVGAAVGVPQRRAVPRTTPRRSPTRRAGRSLTKLQTALSLLRNYSPTQAPRGLPPDRPAAASSTSRAAGSSAAGSARADNSDRKSDEWLLLFVAGMWFQDLWTYDFRRTEMCIIPYATQMGEISFCAYNTGVGWRQIVENMHQNATVAEWYQRARQARRSTPTRASRCRCRRG